MPAIELLCRIVGVSPSSLSKSENQLLEAELFVRLCDELKAVFKARLNDYLQILKLSPEMENAMLESNFVKSIIADIILTGEYTLQGIANYTHTSDEVIYDIAAGNNTAPSLPLSRKIMEIHRSLRPELYRELIKKICSMMTVQQKPDSAGTLINDSQICRP